MLLCMQNLHKPTCIPAKVASIVMEKSKNPRYSHQKCTSESSENVRFIGKTSIKVAQKSSLAALHQDEEKFDRNFVEKTSKTHVKNSKQIVKKLINPRK